MDSALQQVGIAMGGEPGKQLVQRDKGAGVVTCLVLPECQEVGKLRISGQQLYCLAAPGNRLRGPGHPYQAEIGSGVSHAGVEPERLPERGCRCLPIPLPGPE